MVDPGRFGLEVGRMRKVGSALGWKTKRDADCPRMGEYPGWGTQGCKYFDLATAVADRHIADVAAVANWQAHSRGETAPTETAKSWLAESRC